MVTSERIKSVYTSYVDEFKKESDRASVILAAAMLDDVLTEILKSILVSPSTKKDPLFDGAFASFGSFGSKIELALRLGAISDKFARDLKMIKSIRNDFAHRVGGCTFEEQSTQSRVGDLMDSWSNLQKMFKRDVLPEGTRNDFLFVSIWMLLTLHFNLESTTSLNKAKLEYGYRKDDSLESYYKRLLIS